jgi:hypothetical protein
MEVCRIAKEPSKEGDPSLTKYRNGVRFHENDLYLESGPLYDELQPRWSSDQSGPHQPVDAAVKTAN